MASLNRTRSATASASRQQLRQSTVVFARSTDDACSCGVKISNGGNGDEVYGTNGSIPGGQGL